MKRKISSSLTIDETAARQNGFQYGSRVIPQVTWFYADSLLSCRSKSYETVLLHYGNGFSNKKIRETQLILEILKLFLTFQFLSIETNSNRPIT